MFTEEIQRTPFTSAEADVYFKNTISYGKSYCGDDTLLATLRALLYKRLPTGERVALSYNRFSYSSQDLRSCSVETAFHEPIRLTIDDINASGCVGIVSFTKNEESAKAWIDFMTKCLEKEYPEVSEEVEDWYRLQKITDFYKKAFNIVCFINPTKKSVLIFTENLTQRRLHYLQCSIPAILPWYFQPEDGLTNLEMNLINSLREKTADSYKECLSQIASQIDFRTSAIRSLLRGFETRSLKKNADALKVQIEDYIRDIFSYNDRISLVLKRKADAEIRLLGLETKINSEDSEDSEIMNYFLCNKKLSLEEVNDAAIEFTVKDSLEYYDEDMAKRVIDNPNSYIYFPDGIDMSSFIPAEDMKKLMTKIFLDQTIRVNVCAAYAITLGERVSAISNYEYNYTDCIPNPHIDMYSCLGDYARVINELLVENDCVGAIEQCIASCKSINFGDSVVMNSFMSQLYNYRRAQQRKYIVLPNGMVVTPKDAIEWIKEEESNA